MKKILLSLLLASGVHNSFAMQSLGSAAQGGAAGRASAATADDNLSPVDKALFDAVRSGDLENAKARLANVANVNVQNAKGGTALMLAAANGHVDVVRKLLEEGVNVNARNKNRP